MSDGHPKQNALVGFSDEWMRRSMETVFQEKGYQVTRTASGKEALQLARSGRFDVIILDERIEQLVAIDVCIALRDDPLFDHATPIVIVSSAHSTLPSRSAAYAAGAWEYCHQPVDVDALFLKLATFLRARRELAEHQAKSLMDPASGLYTDFGLHQLAEQLEARAVRNHEPFACLAFASVTGEGDTPANRDTARTSFRDLAHAVREQARRSDVIAKRGESRLAVLAPGTDAAGARHLVARLQRELGDSAKGSKGSAVRLRAGYCAVSDLAAAKVEVTELVHRAESALAQVGGTDRDSVLSFDDLAPGESRP